mgnify:CR=1 FL=1
MSKSLTLPKLLAKAQKVFNAWIRARDSKEGYFTCIACFRTLPIDQMNAGHYVPVKGGSALRFNENNVNSIISKYVTKNIKFNFYETFLSEYDPKLRKARGVWYTPAPVVNFIVRAVDDILKTEFDLPQGLADSSKINHPSPSKGGVLQDFY